MNIELDYIQSLIKMASDSDLTELKISSGDNQIIIKKEKETHFAQAVTPTVNTAVMAQTLAVEKNTTTDTMTTDTIKDSNKKGTPVISPIVGTYYSAPSPDSPPFVEIGKKIKVGDVLCIIESMKLMNEIESEVAGTVTEICIENSDAVDAGTVLMYIE